MDTRRTVPVSARKESAIVRDIRERLEADGWLVLKIHGGPMQQAGWPDLMAFQAGVTIFLEVKRPGETATKLQEHRLAELRRRGFTAGVVTSVDDVESMLSGDTLRSIEA